MREPEVLYSDVKFTRVKGNASGTASFSDEPTYSQVRISKIQPPSELPERSQQQAALNGGSKVTSERVAVVVLSVLLAAAVIALGIISFENLQTNRSFQTLRDECEDVKRNLTALLKKQDGVKSSNTVQQTCSDPQKGKRNESCPKCEEGWEQYEEKCYYFSNDKSPWSESRGKCRREGGDLVKIDSTEEQKFLAWKLREKMNEDEDKFWIGLTDSQTEGTLLWVDGSPLNSLTFWSNGEPDNWTNEDPDGEDCVRMGEKSGAADLKCWFDKACKRPHRRICEKSAETGYLKCV